MDANENIKKARIERMKQTVKRTKDRDERLKLQLEIVALRRTPSKDLFLVPSEPEFTQGSKFRLAGLDENGNPDCKWFEIKQRVHINGVVGALNGHDDKLVYLTGFNLTGNSVGQKVYTTGFLEVDGTKVLRLSDGGSVTIPVIKPTKVPD